MYDHIFIFLEGQTVDPARMDGTDGYDYYRKRNLQIKQRYDGVIIKGSLAKYLYGNNIHPFGREEVVEALKKIEEETHLSLKNGKVYSLEIGQTFKVKEPPSSYLRAWNTKKGYKRNTIEGKDGKIETVQYSTTRDSFKGYDKTREAKKEDIFSDDFLIRLELTLKKGTRNLYGHFLSPYELVAPQYYNKNVELWEQAYYLIQKAPVLITNSTDITPSRFGDMLTLKGLQSIGQDSALAIIGEAQAKGEISRINASRTRGMINKMLNNDGLITIDSCTKELDTKVREFVEQQYC